MRDNSVYSSVCGQVELPDVVAIAHEHTMIN